MHAVGERLKNLHARCITAMPADDKYLKLLHLEQECVDSERDVWEWKYICKKCNKVILGGYSVGPHDFVTQRSDCEHFIVFETTSYCLDFPEECEIEEELNKTLLTVTEDGGRAFMIIPRELYDRDDDD